MHVGRNSLPFQLWLNYCLFRFLFVGSFLFLAYLYFGVAVPFLSGCSTIRANRAWVIAGEEPITHSGQTEIIPADMNRANTDSLEKKIMVRKPFLCLLRTNWTVAITTAIVVISNYRAEMLLGTASFCFLSIFNDYVLMFGLKVCCWR